MKCWTTLASALPFALCAVAAVAAAPQSSSSSGTASSLYDLKTSYLDGKPADLGVFRGKVTLAVNVASKCGFTPQYEGLEKLNRELAGKGFAVLGFPSNDFDGQEPGTAKEIAEFCKLTYDVTFPMFSKLAAKPPARSVFRLLRHAPRRAVESSSTRRSGRWRARRAAR